MARVADMIWTMPRPVLHWVGGLLGLGALTAFVMGAINAAERGGRLPGERAPGQPAGAATAINATDATPLAQERIEAPAKPEPKPATNTDDSDDEDTAPQPTNVIPPAKALNATPPVVTPPTPAVNATPAAPPPEDEPPH